MAKPTAAPVATPQEHKGKGPVPTGGAPAGGAPGSNSPSQFIPRGKKVVEFAPGACHAQGCKAKATRFDFCEEHYDHFKFGLIKKTGEQVPDYEKKIEHYLAMKSRAKTSARKVA